MIYYRTLRTIKESGASYYGVSKHKGPDGKAAAVREARTMLCESNIRCVSVEKVEETVLETEEVSR